MTARLSTGDFSRATHLSVKTLRHFHEVGLLEPAHLDPCTGDRYYRPDQIGTAQIIRRLRDLEMPVKGVQGVLAATGVRARQALIAGHLKQMEARLDRTAAAVTAMRTLVEEPERAAAISYRTAPATWALAISAVVTLDELVAWRTAAFDELADTLAAIGMRPAGSRGALYAQDIFERKHGEVLVFIPVARSVPDAGRAQSVLVPDTELAVTVHHGDHNNVDRSYGALGRHVAEHALHVCGPVREYYLVGSEHTGSTEQRETEIAWPIQSTPPPRPRTNQEEQR
ncbi:MAG TPA: MerR family transcriptional regulator [Solirubrobacteraceae bacterium]|jgi:DNA-binding transcriptional MerR regulator